MDFTRSFGALSARRVYSSTAEKEMQKKVQQEMEQDVQHLLDDLEGRLPEQKDSDGTAA
jgi:hypothetical protein